MLILELGVWFTSLNEANSHMFFNKIFLLSKHVMKFIHFLLQLLMSMNFEHIEFLIHYLFLICLTKFWFKFISNQSLLCHYQIIHLSPIFCLLIPFCFQHFSQLSFLAHNFSKFLLNRFSLFSNFYSERVVFNFDWSRSWDNSTLRSWINIYDDLILWLEINNFRSSIILIIHVIVISFCFICINKLFITSFNVIFFNRVKE